MCKLIKLKNKKGHELEITEEHFLRLETLQKRSTKDASLHFRRVPVKKAVKDSK